MISLYRRAIEDLMVLLISPNALTDETWIKAQREWESLGRGELVDQHYPELNEDIKSLLNTLLIRRMEEEGSDSRPILVAIDDHESDWKINGTRINNPVKQMAIGCRHQNLILFMAYQTAGGILKLLAKNADMIVVQRTENLDDLKRLHKDFLGSLTRDQFIQATQRCWIDPYDTMVIDKSVAGRTKIFRNFELPEVVVKQRIDFSLADIFTHFLEFYDPDTRRRLSINKPLSVPSGSPLVTTARENDIIYPGNPSLLRQDHDSGAGVGKLRYLRGEIITWGTIFDTTNRDLEAQAHIKGLRTSAPLPIVIPVNQRTAALRKRIIAGNFSHFFLFTRGQFQASRLIPEPRATGPAPTEPGPEGETPLVEDTPMVIEEDDIADLRRRIQVAERKRRVQVDRTTSLKRLPQDYIIQDQYNIEQNMKLLEDKLAKAMYDQTIMERERSFLLAANKQATVDFDAQSLIFAEYRKAAGTSGYRQGYRIRRRF